MADDLREAVYLMMELPKNADMRLELLCSIPVNPGWVRSKDLMVDFDMTHKEIRDTLDTVQGVDMFNGRMGDGRCFRIAPEHWPAVNERCLRYWKTMYENQD